jgi:hypothetical protein
MTEELGLDAWRPCTIRPRSRHCSEPESFDVRSGGLRYRVPRHVAQARAGTVT